MGLFNRRKKEDLSELQGVPSDTFRCDVCKFIYPKICLCGVVIDAVDDTSKSYILCGICARWLGFKEYRFPQGLCFNFTDEQREKINTLHKELDICRKELGLIDNFGIDLSLNSLEQIPNLREFLRLRLSLSPQNIIDLSDRLTRGELVNPIEISQANKG